MKRVMLSTTRVLTVVLVLFAGAPAWRHAHPNGNRPHTHSEHEHHDHAGLAECQAHVHVTLFGIELTLPVQSEDTDADEQGRVTYLVAACPTIEATQSCHYFDAVDHSLCDVDEPLQLAPTFRCKTPAATFLCDTARHERSGVQLI
jgi:hypothetical protein